MITLGDLFVPLGIAGNNLFFGTFACSFSDKLLPLLTDTAALYSLFKKERNSAMILDHLSRAEKYFNVHTSFKHAFDYLKKTDLRSMPEGRYEIAGDDLYLIIADDHNGKERRKLEAHKKYIDIQIAIEGSFPLEWHDIDSCRNVAAHYDSEKDVEFFNDPPLFTVQIASDMFAVLFPEDAHAPQPPMTTTKKAILKVAV